MDKRLTIQRHNENFQKNLWVPTSQKVDFFVQRRLKNQKKTFDDADT